MTMMALPPLAEVSNLAAWVGQEIDSADPRAGAVLSASSSLVRAYTGRTWTDAAGALADVPAEASAITVQIAARVWVNPAGLESVTLDDGTRRWGSAAGLGLYLTEAEKDVLSAHVDGGPPDLGTISITTGSVGNRTIYVPTGPPPSGYPFPWYASDDPLVQ